jgi:hypothetical protein
MQEKGGNEKRFRFLQNGFEFHPDGKRGESALAAVEMILQELAAVIRQ